MNDWTAEVIVVGLGAFGSAAAWRLAERGVRVIGIDRFDPGHVFGSSHGLTRLFRIACLEHPGYADIATKSLELWTELSQRTGETYVAQTGCLNSGLPDSLPIAGARVAAAAAGLGVEELTHDELVTRFPAYRHSDPATVGLFDPAGGLCYPEVTVRAQQAAAAAAGARLFTGTRVDEIETGPAGVVVHTPTVRFRADQVVVAAGGWNTRFLPGLPLQPTRVPLFWFRPVADTQLDRFPGFIHQLADGRLLWGHGATDRFEVKMGLGDHDSFPAGDPDQLDRYLHPTDDIERLADTVHAAFPSLDRAPTRVAPCLITNSPDGDFLVGRTDERVLVAAGDSGHGFKHCAGIGELLAQLAVGETTYADASFLAPERVLRV